jgi:hypothetical protein
MENDRREEEVVVFGFSRVEQQQDGEARQGALSKARVFLNRLL